MNAELKQALTRIQLSEITEYHVYKGLAGRETDSHNRDVLSRIAEDERRHYDFWASHTGKHPGPRVLVIWTYLWLARLLGLTFAIKLMEKGEKGAQEHYRAVTAAIPEAAAVIRDEHDHENELTAMIDEERLRYIGSTVLGLNDALVELTGALAGFTLALQHGRLIAVIGLITGVAAALSMASSEYLSTRTQQERDASPVKAALYTGVAYIITVMVLVAPYLLFANPFVSLTITVSVALLIILAFSYYVSVAKDVPFWHRLGEMALLSLGVAAVSFGVGYLLRAVVGVEV